MTRQAIQHTLKKIGLRPQTAAGQHFLMDEKVCQQMVEIADLHPQDMVLEIGPGLGVLTRHLLASRVNVTGVELDRRLANYVRQEFKSEKNFQLIENDIFKVNMNEKFSDFGYSVVANLPYGVTSLLFRNLLTIPPRPKRITAMIQKEVAERMTAQPGSMSLLSLSAQHYAASRIVSIVPKTSFWPMPEVTSAIIDLRVINPPPPVDVSARLFRIARVAFSGRRKTLLNSLTVLPPYRKNLVEEALRSAGIAPETRPQELSLEDWLRLVDCFQSVALK